MLQHGAYNLLLDYQYATETRIADEPEALRICSAITQEEQWAATEILRKFFKKTVSGFTNNRYEKELKQRNEWCKRQKNHRDKKRDIAVTVTPESRRSPSIHLPLEETSKSKSKHAPAGAKTNFPTSFELSAQMRSFAIDRGVANPDAEFEAFSDHHTARSSKFSNWEAAWRTWCRNSERFRGSNGARQPVAAGGARTESFDERRRRESEAVLSEVGARARAVVSEMEQRVPNSRAKQITNGNLS